MTHLRVSSAIVPLLVGALFTVSASAQIYLGTSPAQPNELEPFTVLVGISGSCPSAEIAQVSSSERVVEVEVSPGGCLGPPDSIFVELPVGPLDRGTWTLRATRGGQLLEEATVVVALPAPTLTFDPPHPRAGEPIHALLTGVASCPSAGPVTGSGRLLSFEFADWCPILPPDPGPFSLSIDLGDLGSGLYWVQAVTPPSTVGVNGTVASRLLRVLPSYACTPGDTALCLRNGRFRVETRWSTGSRSGLGKVLALTEDSGSFWFFNAQNVELLVKVLSACETANPHFWVFAAGLTNVEVELTVTDMLTGATWSRLHPSGAPFGPILDTSAFDTCFE